MHNNIMEKMKGHVSSRKYRTDGAGNQYEADYQRLCKFAVTTFNQIENKSCSWVWWDNKDKI